MSTISLPYDNDFSDELTSNWNVSGEKSFNEWYEVKYYTEDTPPQGISLNTDTDYTYGGSSKSICCSHVDNEHYAIANVWLTNPQTELYIREYVYYKSPYDFATGHKRCRCGYHTGSEFDWQAMSQWNASSHNLPGPDNLSSISSWEYNGGDIDWENPAGANISSFALNTWMYVEWYIKPGTPGSSDAVVKMWMAQDGQSVSYDSPVASASGFQMLGGSENNTVNYIDLGGWYSNSGNAAAPSPATMYIGRFSISTSWMGPLNSGSGLANYLPFCGYHFYGSANGSERAAFFCTAGLLSLVPGVGSIARLFMDIYRRFRS